MPGPQLHAELSAVRALVSDGLARLTGSVGDPEQYWVAAARDRLTQVDELLVEAADATAAPVRFAGSLTVWIGVVTAAAWGTRAIGLDPGWTAATVTLVALAGWIGTPRVARALRRRRPSRAPATATGAGAAGLLAVPDELLRARVRLVSIILRRVGARRWTAAGLRRAAARDAVVAALARADLLLCQAVDCLENYLDHLEKEQP